MIVGLLTLELAVYEAMSLKDKRRAIKSIKDRIRRSFNVSVAEVGHLDSRQRATLAVAMVSNDASFVHSSFDRIVDQVGRQTRASLIDFCKEIL